MAHPRRVVPLETYLITRRCAQREYRLRPSPDTNRIFMYCLALACQKTGVVVHAACVMSNHHHMIVTDPHGVLPNFLRELHRMTAKALNALHGRRENLWASERCNAVRLTTDEDVAEKIAYVAANPVTARLVEHPDEWPGFVAWGEARYVVNRPRAYFQERGICPPDVELVIAPPPTRDGPTLAAGEWTERIARAIEAAVSVAHAASGRDGKRFIRREAILAGRISRRAESRERRRGVVPTFAAAATPIRQRLGVIERWFRRAYRAALARWRSGERDVAFPVGTWGMRVLHAVAVQAALAA